MDVFVVDRVSRVLTAEAAPIALTTFFGVRVVVAEGGALGGRRTVRRAALSPGAGTQ